jgi:REP element-mobilizing transposase RayT
MPDHIHICISVPPKYSIAMTIGYLKGKSTIRIHREVPEGNEWIYEQEFLDTRVLREYGRTDQQGLLNLDGPEIN